MGNRNGAQRGPLRDIIETLEVGLKEKRMQNRYRLECGHEAWGNKSATRSRCQFCKEVDIKSGGIVPLSSTKVCGGCGIEKPLSEFNKNKRYKDGYVTWCKACYANYREARAKDPEKKAQDKARTDQWYWDNREEKKAKNNARSRERWHNDQEYRDKKNKQKTELIKTNEEYRNKKKVWDSAHRGMRKSKLKNAGKFTPAEWKHLCDFYGNICLCCGEKKPLTVDHVIPLSLGGSNTIANLQCLCLECNLKKNAKTIDYRTNWIPATQTKMEFG